jgi:hypothetical protein
LIKDSFDPAIRDQLTNILGSNQANDFIASLSKNPTPDTLWDTLVRDIFNNKGL